MSDAEEDDDDVDNWDRGEMNSDGSLIITKTTNTAISKHKKGTVKQAAAVLSLAGGGEGGDYSNRPLLRSMRTPAPSALTASVYPSEVIQPKRQ